MKINILFHLRIPFFIPKHNTLFNATLNLSKSQILRKLKLWPLLNQLNIIHNQTSLPSAFFQPIYIQQPLNNKLRIRINHLKRPNQRLKGIWKIASLLIIHRRSEIETTSFNQFITIPIQQNLLLLFLQSMSYLRQLLSQNTQNFPKKL